MVSVIKLLTVASEGFEGSAQWTILLRLIVLIRPRI